MRGGGGAAPGPGHWRRPGLGVEAAAPLRRGALLHLRGRVSGTSAEFVVREISWLKANLPKREQFRSYQEFL